MKKILLVLLVAFSFNSFAENPPPANAFKGTLYGYEVAVYINEVFGGQYGLRAIYKSGSDWIYLAEPVAYESEIDTKAKTDAKFILMIDVINAAAYTELNDISLEPDCCSDRLQWMLENKLTVVDNEIVIN